ncbi:MAG: sensor histidine kinase [Deltaproteobacteria bacterium]|nr:sensor histidine kinase [Deltaproteobacteria bacterium]
MRLRLIIVAAIALAFGLPAALVCTAWLLVPQPGADGRDLALARATARIVARDLGSSGRIVEMGRELFDLPSLPPAELTGVLRLLYEQDDDLTVVVLLDGDDQAVVDPVFLRADQIGDGSARDSRLPVDESDLARFLRHLPIGAARDSGRAVSDVYVDSRHNEVLLSGAALVSAGAGKRPWVLGFERRLRRVRQIAATGALDRSYVFFVVDDGGRLVVHPDGRRSLERERITGNPLVDEYLAGGRSGIATWRGQEGMLAGAYQRLDPMAWAVVVQRAVAGPQSLAGVPMWLWLALGGAAALVGLGAWLASIGVRAVQREADQMRQRYERRAEELQKMQASLLETRKLDAIGDLGAGVAHEFNNPLGGILGLTQLLLRRKKEDDPELQFLRRIEAEAKRCKAISDNLLRFSEQQSSGHREPLRLGRVVDLALDLIRSRFEGRGVRIETSFPADLPRVVGNQGQLQRAVLNVLLNADTAMPERGTLKLAGTLDGDWVELRISDTGRGIAKENIDRVFEPFFTTKDDWKGAGLGLYEVYQIISDHGGSVSVESEQGVGTTVLIRLQRIQDATRAPVPMA